MKQRGKTGEGEGETQKRALCCTVRLSRAQSRARAQPELLQLRPHEPRGNHRSMVHPGWMGAGSALQPLCQAEPWGQHLPEDRLHQACQEDQVCPAAPKNKQKKKSSAATVRAPSASFLLALIVKGCRHRGQLEELP